MRNRSLYPGVRGAGDTASDSTVFSLTLDQRTIAPLTPSPAPGSTLYSSSPGSERRPGRRSGLLSIEQRARTLRLVESLKSKV